MNAWDPLVYLLVFGLFCYCLVKAVASMRSDARNPNRPDGEAGLATFLSVLVLFLLVGVFFGGQSEQQPSVAEEAAEQQVPFTTEEGTTEEDTTEEDTTEEGATEEGTKQPSIEPEEPPQQAPTEPEALPQYTPPETEGPPQNAPVEPEGV